MDRVDRDRVDEVELIVGRIDKEPKQLSRISEVLIHLVLPPCPGECAHIPG